jgi:uncharacterized membrane protein YgcG
LKHFFLTLVALSGLVALSSAQTTDVQDAYRALETQTYWVHPSAASKIKTADLDDAANKVKPLTLKVLVVPELGGQWVRNRRERRGAYAKWLLNQQLGLKNGIAIVLTKKGVAGYSDQVPESKLTILNNQAATRASRTDFTPAITWLATSIGTAAKDGTMPVAASSAEPVAKKEKGSILPVLLVLGILGVGGFFLVRSAMKSAAIGRLKARLEPGRQEVLEGISYLDKYDGLLADRTVTSQLIQHRQTAFDAYEKAQGRLATLKTEADAAYVQEHLQDAARSVADGKNLIAEATGGTKTAFQIPASLQEIDTRKSPLFEPKAGVDFFTGQYADDLQPIEIAIDGNRRTVMASRDSIQALQSGQAPQIAGQNLNGRFTPWYGVPDYEPGYGRGYGFGGGGSIVGDLLMFSAFNSLFNPFDRGYDRHGSYNSGFADGANYAENHASPQDSGFDTSGGFDFGSSDNSFDSGGGFDFGGGDSGGGFDGGGDFGGSFD